MNRLILLVEDDVRKAAPIKAALEDRGHGVIWVTGIPEVPNTEGICYGTAPNSWSKKIPLRLSDFGAAFLDFTLDGIRDGDKIINDLQQAGVKTCAIATDAVNNLALKRFGAVTSCLKKDVVSNLGTLLQDLF